MIQTLSASVPFTVAAVWPPAFDDSALAPAGYETRCQLPQGDVYDAHDFGAIGNGITDDTVALRTLFAKANLPGSVVIAYLPTGTYNVCPQAGDPANPGGGGVIFDFSLIPESSQLVIIGDGPTLTTIKGFMPGLADPETTWDVVGGEVSRFIMFQSITSGTAAGSFQIRSLTVDGQAGWTGDYTVGGNVTTGDGWDTRHKCIRTDGPQAVGDVLVFNSKLINWRGEIVYAGGGAATSIASVLSTIDSTNASAISASTAYLDAYSTTGPNVYNAVENFCINGNQSFIADHSTFSGKNYGIVYLGVQSTHADIGHCTITGNIHGMLVSELGFNMNIHDCTFTNAVNGWINSTLGLYPQYGRGYGNITFDSNSFAGNSTPIQLGDKVDRLVLTNNTCGGLPYIDISDVVEHWPMSETSNGSSPVTRAGSMSSSPAINPGLISLTDTSSTPSITLPSGGVAANFASGDSMTNQATGATGGRFMNRIFIGTGSWSIFMRVYFPSLPGSTGFIVHREVTKSWQFTINQNHRLAFASWNARGSTLTTTTSTLALQANREYSAVFGYDLASDRQFIHVVDDAGNITHTYSATGICRRNPYSRNGMFFGGGDRGQPMGGAMRDVWFFRSAIDDATIMRLHNSGSPLILSTSRVLLSDRVSGWWPRPFSILGTTTDFDTSSGVNSRGGSANGVYWYRPFPLFQWSPSLATAHGDYVWFHSSDHSAVNTNAGAGIWMGFSSGPSVRPASWTQIIPGTGTDTNGVGYVQLETPHLAFQGGTFYLSAHGVDAINPPPGLSNPQETRLWTSTDLATWTLSGTSIPAINDGTAIAKNHTGYAVVYPPNSLPGQADWRATHLGNDTLAIYYCSPSSDGLLYLTDDDAEELDDNGQFPAGFDNVQWFNSLFSPDGVSVYGIGRGYFPGGRGTLVAEMSFENGAWRMPTGRVWRVTSDTDVQPTLGYTQDVRAWMDTNTKILHCYVLRGFFKDNGGDERIDYVRLQF